MTPAEAVREQVLRIVAVNDALYRAADDTGANAAMRERVATWHDQALLWIQLGNGVADGSNPRAAEWSRLADKLAATARDLGTEMEAETVLGRVKEFAAGMPNALAVVTGRAVAAVGAAVGGLVLSLPGPLLAVLGVAVVGVAWFAVRPILAR